MSTNPILIKVQNNQLVLSTSFSKSMSTTVHATVLNKIYLIPIYMLSQYFPKINISRRLIHSSSRRTYYEDILDITSLSHVLNNGRNKKIPIYQFSFTNSRNLDVTKYIIDLNNQRITNMVIKDHQGLLPYFLTRHLSSINTINGLWIRLQAYGLGMIEVIRQAERILNINLSINANVLGPLIYKWTGLHVYMLASYITYSNGGFMKSLRRILQGLHEVYVLALLGVAHYQCSNRAHNIKTIMYRNSIGGYYWSLHATKGKPASVIQTPNNDYYTIWYQQQLPNLKIPDIIVYKGLYNSYDELYKTNSIDKIILIDAKIKYDKNDHNRLVNYINVIKQLFNPRELIVVLPFLEDLASSANYDPFNLRPYVGAQNLHVIEDVCPGGTGDLEFMEIICKLMP